MRQLIYLIADSYGAIRMTKRAPALARNEIAVVLTITIPNSAFRAPTVPAELNVADTQVIHPEPEIAIHAAEEEGIALVLSEMAENGLVQEVEPGHFALTEWGGAQARRLLKNSPEARELFATLEANRERIVEALKADEPA